MEKLLEALEEVKEGDLQHLEKLIMQSVMELGWQEMETIPGQQARDESLPAGEEQRKL